MKSLITGGTGFIGDRLAKALNQNIVVLARRKHEQYKTIICDLEKDNVPEDVFDGVDSVYHLAGIAHDSRDSRQIPNIYYEVNVRATIQLANLAAKSGVKSFVFVSSVKASGYSNVNKCMNEINQTYSEGIYGRTKREAEINLLKIGKEFGMHVSIIRPSLVYGPNVKGNLRLMLSGIKKGWFPPLPEIRNRRSMIHVDDLVRAILMIAEDKRANGEIFIATDGTPYSSREIYNAMCNAAGKSIPKWSVPKVLFNIIGLLSSKVRYKVTKLLGNEFYSSEKLEALGFKAEKSLKDINETDF